MRESPARSTTPVSPSHPPDPDAPRPQPRNRRPAAALEANRRLSTLLLWNLTRNRFDQNGNSPCYVCARFKHPSRGSIRLTHGFSRLRCNNCGLTWQIAKYVALVHNCTWQKAFKDTENLKKAILSGIQISPNDNNPRNSKP